MKISNVFAGLSDPTGIIKHLEKTESKAKAAGSATTAEPETVQTDTSAEALRKILAKYDVADITPNDFTKMVQELRDAGAISKEDVTDLASVRLDLEQAAVQPDDSVNLLDFYRDRIQKIQQNSEAAPAEKQQLGAMQHRLEWLQKLATSHGNPESIGLSTTA